MRVAPVAYLQQAVGGPYPAFPYEADLKVRYDFNEGTGTTVNDISGNGINATANNSDILSNQTAGIFSGEYCADFTGGSRVIYDTTGPLGCSSVAFTGAFWAKWNSTAPAYVTRYNANATCGGTNGQTAFIYRFGGGPLQMFNVCESNGNNSRFNVIEPSMDTWYFITVTYPGSCSVGGVKTYVDGVFAGSNAAIGGPNGAASDILIGGANSGASNSFDGLIDEWSIFDFEMSATQVAELYNWYANNPSFAV